MFVVDEGSESGAVDADSNVEKFNRRVRDSAREFKSRLEELDKGEEDQLFVESEVALVHLLI